MGFNFGMLLTLYRKPICPVIKKEEKNTFASYLEKCVELPKILQNLCVPKLLSLVCYNENRVLRSATTTVAGLQLVEVTKMNISHVAHDVP